MVSEDSLVERYHVVVSMVALLVELGAIRDVYWVGLSSSNRDWGWKLAVEERKCDI